MACSQYCTETTNLFFIKSFSPFTQGYAPALAELRNPISEREFSDFINGVNDALLATSAAQLSFVTGGLLMNVPILPVQGAGAFLQGVSLAASAGVSFIRAKKYMADANAKMFHPRNLEAKLMGTKKMMAAIGYTPTDANGKLTLPPALEQNDEAFYSAAASLDESEAAPSTAEDPRVRRLRALEGHIAPLDLAADYAVIPEQWFKKYSTAPTRWLNGRDIKKMTKARSKWLEKRGQFVVELGDELAEINREIAQLGSRDETPWTFDGGSAIDAEMANKIAKRNVIIGRILQSGDKKGEKRMRKSDKREAKGESGLSSVLISSS